MDYIKKNKVAWEAAYDHKDQMYEKDMIKRLTEENNAYLTPHMIDKLDALDLSQKTVGQFCTNNGRELLSIAKRGIQLGIGFDIAKNMVEAANQMAEVLKQPVLFIETNILEINETYHHMFDVLIITVGALCWFKDLKAFFKVAAACLKKEGVIIIEEIHPLSNMLATKDEANHIKDYPKAIVNDYFKEEPWIEGGMGYMTQANMRESFISFSHSLSHILSACIASGLVIEAFDEYDMCIANLFTDLSHEGLPLTMHILGRKK